MKKIFIPVLFVLSFIFLCQHLFFITQGYYITGDTVSYLQNAMRGKPLTVFIQADPTWPPMTALLFNFFRLVSKNVIVQQKSFIICLLLANFIALYMLFKNFVESKLMRFTLVTFILLAGVHSLLSFSALSESFFVLLLTLSILLLVKFHLKSSESTLFLFSIVTSLLPMSRYIGIYLLCGYSLYFILQIYKKRGTTYAYYILCLLFFMWLPIGTYMLRSKIEYGYFMVPVKSQHPDIHFFEILVQQNIQLIRDLWLGGIIAIVSGYLSSWKRQNNPLLFFSGSTVIVYEIGLALSKNLYYFNKSSFLLDNFPSRYMAVIYPTALVFTLLLSSYLFRKVKRKRLLVACSYLVTALFFAYLIFSMQTFISKELKSPASEVGGAEYTKDIESFCKGNGTGKLIDIVQPTSHNHIARGFPYFCDIDLTINPSGQLFIHTHDSIFTPYIMKDEGLKLSKIYIGFYNSMEVYRYSVLKDTDLDLDKLQKTLHLLD